MQNQAIKYKAQFYIEELKALFYFDTPLDTSFSISTDSRNIEKEQIFLPLQGECFDGHDFIDQVIESGIKLSFCERKKISKVKEAHKPKLILVHDTLEAYHLLAAYYRRKVNPTVIAVTGSSGKTTLKDLLADVLATRYKTHKTEANFNNEFGVPKTILEMSPDTKVLILELGMRAKGEIGYLARTANPDIAVITSIGTAHIGRLGSIEEIIKTKAEMLEYLKENGLAVLCNEPRLLDYAHDIWAGKTATVDLGYAKDISFQNGRSVFTLFANGVTDERYSINALGNIHVLNSLFAILIGKYLGVTRECIHMALLDFKNSEGRGNIIKLRDDVYLIDESYNANPDSVRIAVDTLMNCWSSDYRKILVLGELAELGDCEESLLRALGEWLMTRGLSYVITVGDKLTQINNSPVVKNVRNIQECCAILKGLLTPKTVALIKGSHVANLEKVIQEFSKEYIAKWRVTNNH